MGERAFRSMGVAAIDACLRVAFALSPRVRRKADVAALEPRRILVSRPDHIGDAILAIPALAALRERYPRAHITMMVASWAAEVYRYNRNADALLVVDPPWWVAKRNAGIGVRRHLASWRAFLARIGEIRRGRYELLVELRGDVRHIVAFGCLGAVRHIVTCRRNGGHFLADAWLAARDERHEMRQGADLVALLGARATDTIAKLHSPAESLAIAGLLRAHGILPHHHVVVMHPGAKPVNRWPVENYAALASRLLRDPAVRIVVTGSAAEAPLANAVRAANPLRVVSLAGRISLLELAALLERASLFIGADTGPMHLLNACATPALLIFGPTSPARFAPLSAAHAIVRAARCCEAALHETCRESAAGGPGACMRSVDVESACKALETLCGAASTSPFPLPVTA
jgi:ADP-heptose:LPS heptosyltransferase